MEWRYLYQGKVKHAVDESTSGLNSMAVCGVPAYSNTYWLGTGSQDEYDTVKALRPCRRCVREVGEPK